MKLRPPYSWSLLLLVLVWPAALIPPGPISSNPSTLYEMPMEQVCIKVVQDSSLFTEGWDTLYQPRFWRLAMRTSHDSVLVNLADNREIVGTISYDWWMALGNKSKKAYEDSVREANDLSKKDMIYFTAGRSHFYQLDNVREEIDVAIELFLHEETDPWYAQAILMIESPGRLQFSTVGAYGAFQLMPGVARELGLVVNDSVDERADFNKAAVATSHFLKTTVIPKTVDICRRRGIQPDPEALWFRLLAMHVYHAGARNVNRAVRRTGIRTGSRELIEKLWVTRSRRFGNASQNYTQIVLAAFMEMEDLLQSKTLVCPVKRKYKPKAPAPTS